jgi:hypothetical protein
MVVAQLLFSLFVCLVIFILFVRFLMWLNGEGPYSGDSSNSPRFLYWGKREQTENGYIRRLSDGKWGYEHRQIAERIMGRALTEFEVVHHINGRPSDNREENLCLMSERNHLAFHDWYDWIVEEFGNYPKLDTQKRKLREDFNGLILSEADDELE